MSVYMVCRRCAFTNATLKLTAAQSIEQEKCAKCLLAAAVTKLWRLTIKSKSR